MGCGSLGRPVWSVPTLLSSIADDTVDTLEVIMRTIPLASAILALAGAAAAAEVDVADLRLAGGVLPKTFKGGATTTVTTSGGTVTSSTGVV
jgi:hypothetical protein